MKFKLLSLFIFLISTQISNSQESIDLFIWAGQSNAQGWMGDAAHYPADPNNIDNQTRLNYTFIDNTSSNGWVAMQAQSGRFPLGHFGPEVSFSRGLKTLGANPAIFKYTKGSTSLKNDWKGPGEGGHYDSMVTDLMNAITDLESQGHTVNIRGFIWIQGESDSQSPGTSNGYYDTLISVINDIRNIANNSTLPIILGMDEQHPWVVLNPIVLGIQNNIAASDANINYTSMIGLPKADETHLTPVGLVTHGEQIFYSILPLLPELVTNPNNAVLNTNGCVACDNYAAGNNFVLNGEIYTVVDRNMLESMISNGEDVTKACVSKLTDMSRLLFNESNFNQDISSWDVSNVTKMEKMFQNATTFNQNIGNWDVTNVTDMRSMFRNATMFNQDIGNWNTANVTQTQTLFFGAINFNQNIGNWNMSNVSNMSGMFFGAKNFNQNISNWDVSNVTNMSNMFRTALAFNQDIGNWDVSNVYDMESMFRNSNSFNQDLNQWCVTQIDTEPNLFSHGSSLLNTNYPLWGSCPDESSTNPFGAFINSDGCVECDNYLVGAQFELNGDLYVVVDRAALDIMVANNNDLSKVCVSKVTDMSSLFNGKTTFNQDITSWDVSNVTDMSQMFYKAKSFDQSIGNWDVSGVSTMRQIFYGAETFNQDIGSWNVSQVTDMSAMFRDAETFNQNIGSWDVSSVNLMNSMFFRALNFNQYIGGWNVSNVSSLRNMFFGASSFNQNIGNWNVSNVTDMSQMFRSAINFDQNIGGWDVSNVKTMRRMFRNAVLFNQDLGNWNVSNVTDMERMFMYCSEFNQDIGNWDVSNVTDMGFMFFDDFNFNQSLENWDVSNVTSMEYMFAFALAFNQDIGNWNVSNVSQMESMFEKAIAFDQDLSNWCVSQINSEPADFSYNSALSNSHKPIWGASCTSSTNTSQYAFKSKPQDTRVYPNPFKINENRELTIVLGNKMAVEEIRLLDLYGRKIEINSYESKDNKILFDMPSYISNGVYVIQIKSGRNVFSKQIAVRH